MKYMRQGTGPSVILQHGFLSGAEYWGSLASCLSDSFDVIATNLPGYADNTEGGVINRIEDFADFVLELVDELEIHRFSMLGHSMGGMIAQEVALKSPEKLEKLILFGTGPNGVIPGRFETIEASRQRVLQEGAESTITKTVASWFMKGENDPSYLAGIDMAKQSSVSAMLAGYEAWEHWSSVSRLNAIDTPTLIVWGDQDKSYNWQQIEQLWDSIPNAQLSVLPGCAHNAHLEKETLFNAVVKGFLLESS
ncbi:MAG: alpha/beta hydrolase [Acidiferrobacterales bacterium]|nr:alpha/beta hydrolase [Acidiferrobacterales bacterium]